MPKKNLYKLGKKLGLNKNDIDDVLKDRKMCYELTFLTMGPDEYKDGTLYGTISIKDF